MITEVDQNLKIIRRKEFQINEISNTPNVTWGYIGHLITFTNNQYYCNFGVGSIDDEEGYLVELDSSFAVKKRILFPMDSLYSFGFQTMLLNKDKKHFDCSGLLKEKENDPSKQFILRMDTNGNIKTIRYLNEMISDITSMSPTFDGGYITGPQLLKFDSNLNTQWMKPTGGKIYSVVQLGDSSYICGGISNGRTISLGQEPAYEIYMVRMDKDGNYNYSGIEDGNIQLSDEIIVYPNPSLNGLFMIKSKQLTPQTIHIYNTNGQLIYTSTNGSTTIDLSSFANGMYSINIQNKKGAIVTQKKILIQR